jgi:hypothetical protein
MTGMGGGALMTPILLIFFGINPTTAVSSDLVAAMVMKPVGGGVHVRRKTVQWGPGSLLCVGSIPMAFAGVFILHATGDNEDRPERHEDPPRCHPAACAPQRWCSRRGSRGGGARSRVQASGKRSSQERHPRQDPADDRGRAPSAGCSSD